MAPEVGAGGGDDRGFWLSARVSRACRLDWRPGAGKSGPSLRHMLMDRLPACKTAGRIDTALLLRPHHEAMMASFIFSSGFKASSDASAFLRVPWRTQTACTTRCAAAARRCTPLHARALCAPGRRKCQSAPVCFYLCVATHGARAYVRVVHAQLAHAAAQTVKGNPAEAAG